MPSVLCPVLVGRRPEVEQLVAAVAAVAEERRGSTLFLIGEAGVGKSRLAREALDLARRRHFSVLWGRATPAASQVAFRALAEALHSRFRDEGPPDSPELEPFRPILGRLVPDWRTDGSDRMGESIVLLAEAVLRVLRVLGRTHGCLLVLEDLHWADPDTMAIVEYLADNLAAEPVVCIATLRPEASSPGLAVASSLAARRAAAAVELSPLAPAEVVAMVRSCMDGASLPAEFEAILQDSADGLPFLVEELLAGAAGAGAVVRSADGWKVEPGFEPAVPRTLLASVVERLEALGPAARSALGAAAVLGRRFDWTVLPILTEMDEREVLAALGRATAAQLLVCEQRGHSSFRFRHALTRDAVLGQLMPAERTFLASGALEAVERLHPDLEDDWCELAAQLADQTGDRDRAAALLLRAGRRSLAQGALATAETTLERALEMANENRALVLAVQEARCETLSLAGKADRALEVGSDLVSRLQLAMDPAGRRCQVHLRLARTAASACHWDVAEAHLASVADLADPDESITAQTAAIRAHVFLGRGNPEEATQAALAALDAAERVDLHEVSCEALEVVGRAKRLNDVDGAERAFVRAHDLAAAHGLTLWRVRAMSELGTLDVLMGRGLDRLLAARELALASGSLAVAAHVDLHLAGWHAQRLDGERIVEAARRCGDTARRFGLKQLLAMALVFEADGWARTGHEEESEALLQQAFALRGDDLDVCAMAWAHVRARISLIAENRRRGLQELETAMSYFRRQSTSPQVVGRAWWALLAAVEDRDGEAALAELRASGATANVLVRGYGRLTEAVLFGRSGQMASAEEAFADGDELLAAIPWHRQFGRRLVADAAIADGWGDPAVWMQEALPVFEDHGHDQIAAACRSLLRQAGAPVPRRGTSSGVSTAFRSLGITAREAEVLGLLADGLPNREIAERLYLSPRTVERHIANVSVKAGVRTRSELIAFAARATSDKSSAR